jgi:hypothetical protein
MLHHRDRTFVSLLEEEHMQKVSLKTSALSLVLPRGRNRLLQTCACICLILISFERSANFSSPSSLTAFLADNCALDALRFASRASTEPVRWDMAVTAAENVEDLEPGQIYGYGVDCGTGAFADPAAFAGVSRDSYEAVLDALLEKLNAESFAVMPIGAGNVVAF